MRRMLHRRRVLHLVAVVGVVFVVFALIRQYGGGGDKEQRRRHVPKSDLYRQSDVSKHIRSNGRQAEYIDKKGVHVVVGKYVGDSLSKDPKLGWSELNANNFDPARAGAGEDGEPVILLPSEEIRSKRLWHVNKFNIVASDKVALNRSVPDVRRATCRARDFRKKDGKEVRLPDASVVIVFHNEAWSTLLRTVHSVINRSARRDLREVILVDDASNR